VSAPSHTGTGKSDSPLPRKLPRRVLCGIPSPPHTAVRCWRQLSATRRRAYAGGCHECAAGCAVSTAAGCAAGCAAAVCGCPRRILGEERVRLRQKAGSGGSRHPKAAQNRRLAFGRLPPRYTKEKKTCERYSRTKKSTLEKGELDNDKLENQLSLGEKL